MHSYVSPCSVRVLLRGRRRHALSQALAARRSARAEARADDECRAWTLFYLAPYMLLHRPRNQGSVGKAVLEKRFDDYAAGSWAKLLPDVRASDPADKPRASDAASTLEVEW